MSEVDRWLIRGAPTILARRSRALPFLGGGLLCGLGGRRTTFFLAHSYADTGRLRLGRRERGRVERGSLRAESLLLQGSVGEDAGVELPTDGCVHGYTVACGYMHFMNTRANAARVPLLSNEAQLKFRA